MVIPNCSHPLIAAAQPGLTGVNVTLFTHNVYHCFGPGGDGAVHANQMAFAGGAFTAWQLSGQDAGSTIGDPLFVDPASGDFRIASSASPAFSRGFQQLSRPQC